MHKHTIELCKMSQKVDNARSPRGGKEQATAKIRNLLLVLTIGHHLELNIRTLQPYVMC